MTKEIDPDREYTLEEIVEEDLVPIAGGYSGLYNRVTQKIDNPKKSLGYSRVPAKETTITTIKQCDNKRPWNSISQKITVSGSELIKFLEFNT